MVSSMASRDAPDPEFSDPAGSGSCFPGAGWIRTGSRYCGSNWIDYWALHCLTYLKLLVERLYSKKVLDHTYQLSILRETVRVLKHLWGEASKPTSNNRQKNFHFSITIWSIWTNVWFWLTCTVTFTAFSWRILMNFVILRLMFCLWHLINWAEVP